MNIDKGYSATITTPALNAILKLGENNSTVEDGGKLLGYCNGRHFTVFGVIPSGPESKNSRFSLFQDGVWQLSVFRTIEQNHPELDWIGSTHHHLSANNFNRLSAGDIETYQHYRSHEDYRHEAYLSILLHQLPSCPIVNATELEQYFTVNLIASNDLIIDCRLLVQDEFENQLNFSNSYCIQNEIDSISGQDIPWYKRNPMKDRLLDYQVLGARFAMSEHYLRIFSKEKQFVLRNTHPDTYFFVDESGQLTECQNEDIHQSLKQ